MATSSPFKIESLLGMLTIKLNDENYLKWRYQIESVLEGYDLFGHFDGTLIAPPKFAIVGEERVTSTITAAYREWSRANKALVSLLIATLSDEAIEYVIGSKTAREAWLSLTDRYATKGADTIEKFLLRLKRILDQLSIAGVSVSDDDLMITALNGFPAEYDMIKTVLVARDTSISLKDFPSKLLAAEQSVEERVVSSPTPIHAMVHRHTSTTSTLGVSQDTALSGGAGLLPTPLAFFGTQHSSRPSFGRGRASMGRSVN
ncbi:unnamed protein product [Prunus armeniaca]